MCERKVSNFIFHSFFIDIYLCLGPLQPDGCKLSVLLTFSYVKEKLCIFQSSLSYVKLIELYYITLSYYPTIYDIEKK